MIFSVFIGILLGLSGLRAPAAIGILAICLVAKAVIDIRWDRMPLLRRVSPFIVYCHNLSLSGESTEQAHITYTLQLIFFGSLLGSGAYAVVRFFA